MTTIRQFIEGKQKYFLLINQVRDDISTLNPVEVVTPINVASEKKKWIEQARRGNFTNPDFKYNLKLLSDAISKRELLAELEPEIRTASVPASEAERFILEQLSHVLRDGIDTTLLAESILCGCDDDSKKIIARKYGLPGIDSVDAALIQVSNNLNTNEFEHAVESEESSLSRDDFDSLSGQAFDAEDIRDYFDWTMLCYKGHWPIQISSSCTSIDVRDKSTVGHPVIMIPSNRNVSGFKLAELIGHEIECHWRTSVNAELIGILKSDDELIYEGLAALKDKTFNRKYLGSFNLNSAYYVLAMREALSKKSFTSVGKMIYDHLPVSLGESRAAKAWLYTYRVFRGIIDTENPVGYAFTKDRAYFDGYNYVKKLVDEGRADYLSFSTLDQKGFERLMNMLTIDDITHSEVVLDQNIQDECLSWML